REKKLGRFCRASPAISLMIFQKTLQLLGNAAHVGQNLRHKIFNNGQHLSVSICLALGLIYQSFNLGQNLSVSIAQTLGLIHLSLIFHNVKSSVISPMAATGFPMD